MADIGNSCVTGQRTLRLAAVTSSWEAHREREHREKTGSSDMMRCCSQCKADGEGFELPLDSPGNPANSNPRDTNPTRARNEDTLCYNLPPEIAELVAVCCQLNQEAVARVLNFAKFELSTVALAAPEVPLRCPSNRTG
jgi:hypothetical protein